MSSATMTRLELHDVDAERTVLGALMLDTSKFDAVREQVGARDFASLSHQRVFAAIEQLATSGALADPVTVGDLLARRGELSEVGDLSYLAQLTMATPSAANVVRYARIVAERSLRRRVLMTGQGLCDGAMGEAEDVATLIGQTLDAMTELVGAEADTLADSASVALAGLDFVMARYANPDQLGGAATGFADIDKRLLGMKGGDLVVVAGRPAMGKSIYALMVANHIAEHDGPVLYASLEMSRVQLGIRQLAAIGSVNSTSLQSGDLDDEAITVGLPRAAGKLKTLPVEFDFRPGMTVQQLRARARAMKRRGGLAAVVVDYLQLLVPSRGSENRANELGEISRGLKALARELDVPLIALSQLSRKVEERANKRPLMSDLRESGAIEQDADVIQMLYRDEYYNPDSMDKGLVEVITVKARQGECGTDTLVFQGEFCRMRSMDAASRAERAAAAGRPRVRARYSALD